MKKKRRAAVPSWMKVAAFVIILVLTVNVVSLQLQINDLRSQSDTLEREISRKTLENKELKESYKEGDTAESIAKIARDSLGYAYPGEKIYKDSSGK